MSAPCSASGRTAPSKCTCRTAWLLPTNVYSVAANCWANRPTDRRQLFIRRSQTMMTGTDKLIELTEAIREAGPHINALVEQACGQECIAAWDTLETLRRAIEELQSEYLPGPDPLSYFECNPRG